MSKFIQITEVGPRDGFQNIKQPIPTELKIEIIDKLIAAGANNIEITSMVSPKAIPQMSDAKAIIAHVLACHPDITPWVLVPNRRGAQLAVESQISHVNYVVSVSPAHNKANINRTHQESLEELHAIRRDHPSLEITLSLATAFGCPFLGATSADTLLSMIQFAQDQAIRAITLCDTIGVANPRQTAALLQLIGSRFPEIDIGLHMHNTHGMALANMLVGLQNGVTRFETAIGGLGGCPFAPGAAGNAATEDAVNMFSRMGLECGISLDALLPISAQIRESIEPALLSSLSRARTYSEFNFYPLHC